MQRVEFGRDEIPVSDGRRADLDLSAAVLASCAIPGYFRPIEIAGRTYIDGGVRSPTNADVLTRAPVDVAIVISPMSGRPSGRFGPAHLIRRHASAKVGGEVKRLQRGGIATVLVEPGREVVEAIGTDLMGNTRLGDIVSTAFLDAGHQLREAAASGALAGIGHRRAGRTAFTVGRRL
jgi:NTE family protein